MKSETRTFRLKVLSPVHIGCGHVYEPTSFVIKVDKRVLVGFDSLVFLESLTREKVDSFSGLCKQGTVESLLDIYRFISDEAQDIDGREVGVGAEFIGHYQSVLQMDRNNVRKNLNQFEIHRTAFTPLGGQVYIPGSAVKGSLRTAILNSRYKKQFKNENNNRKLQKKILNGKFETDPFSRVKVSDFRPVGPVTCRIVYAVCKKKKKGKKSSTVYQIMEVIEPGGVFEGTVTIQVLDKKEVLEEEAVIKIPIDFAEIRTSLTSFFGGECQREAHEAKIIGVQHHVQADNGMVMRIGRHSGAECVTIADKRRILSKVKKGKDQILDHATTIWFASDRKDPMGTETLKPFGWVALYEREEFIRRQAAELEDRKKKEEKKRKAEEELKKYPWRPWLKNIQDIDDWGMFRQLVLDNKEAASWRDVEEVGPAIFDIARRVRKKKSGKWAEERDILIDEWLKPTGREWPVGEQKNREKPPASPLVTKILEYKDWGEFKQSPIAYEELDFDAANALQKKFIEWGCKAKKAKNEKKEAWRLLQSRRKQLKS